MCNRIRNSKHIPFFGKVIPIERLYASTSVFILCASVIVISTFLLALTENFPLYQILFETTSVIETAGITGDLTAWEKVIILFVIFAGRLDTSAFDLAIFARRNEIKTKADEAGLAI